MPQFDQISSTERDLVRRNGAATMIDTEPLIAIESVSKSFADRLAVDRVTLEIPAGEITALLGPNGGGKTTLFA